MKARICFTILAVLSSGYGKAEPPVHPEPDSYWNPKADVLSTDAGMMMSGLAASAPDPLRHEGLCDSNGLCGESVNSAFQELARFGLVTRTASGDYQLTAAGTEYIDSHWEVTRRGETTIVRRRDTHK